MVKAIIHPESSAGWSPGDLEPVYSVSACGELIFPKGMHGVLKDYFCHSIARDPNDLRSHVRRILLEYEEGNSPGLYAALLDLFIALGKRGVGLRKRMLELAKAMLEPQQFKLLSDSFGHGLEPLHAPIISGSILGRGIEGSLDMIHPVGGGREGGARDALVEAREYIEYSQLDEARVVLERAILREPQRTELYMELLDVYRSTRDSINFSRMSWELKGREIPVPEAWQELMEYFRSFNG